MVSQPMEVSIFIITVLVMKNQLSSISDIYCSGVVAKIPLLSHVQSTAFPHHAHVRDQPI